jgi:F-type H+-transporting ATPase subunit b
MTILLAESSGIGGLFTALGLNLQSLVLNTLAFLVIVAVLGKYVYPSLIKALDAKQDELEAAARFEREAKTALETAGTKADGVVAEARAAASDILAAAKADAVAQIEAARAKMAEQSERTLAEAREHLARDVNAARQTLKHDTAKLVASAAETVLGEKLDSSSDAALIGRSLEGK